jgi:hypothetical protein
MRMGVVEKVHYQEEEEEEEEEATYKKNWSCESFLPTTKNQT